MQLPISLINSLDKLPGFNRDSFLRVHESVEQVTSIRVNPWKWAIPNFTISPQSPISQSAISQSAISQSAISKVPWSSNGYYLSERPSFTLDPFFHAGVYYVQEPSSMFLEQALKQTVDLSQPLRILDLCAAPGGKSTLIASLMNEESLLVSNEVIKTRVKVLQENLVKWGERNVVVTNNDAKDFSRLGNYFDVIVVDAPCSGSGLFRKDREAISEWSAGNVELCRQRQMRILADVFPSLKKNGILIYSTCSYSAEENEDILDWLKKTFGVQSLRLELDPDWQIVESSSPVHSQYGYRFYPDKLKGEGFFIAAFEKLEGEETQVRSKKSFLNLPTKNEISLVKNWIKHDEEISIIKHQDEAIGISPYYETEIPILQKNLYLKQVGVTIGKFTAKELVPNHALAMSHLVSPAIASISLNKEAALQYLRRADVIIDVGQKGWVLVEYNGINLGWIKNLENRVNNYYPKEWRILMR